MCVAVSVYPIEGKVVATEFKGRVCSLQRLDRNKLTVGIVASRALNVRRVIVPVSFVFVPFGAAGDRSRARL